MAMWHNKRYTDANPGALSVIMGYGQKFTDQAGP
jgi:hypothetical protein